MQYNVLDARNQFSRLIEAAEAGEEVVIARRGKPVLKFVLIDDEAPLGSPARVAQALAKLSPTTPSTFNEIEAEIRDAKSGWSDDH
ncbi:MAG: type II toxin-antitoxin system prevent-host-death family antitoxin [Solirubrobacterales bacterium]|nr:type II toxin-antitoxin system prevent-host-death family antitoxin [Solirubrobacterales bacterium]